MANAIKKISVQRGYDVTRYALNCFGGAGGQHACLVADALGMTRVLIHPFSSLLSAYGMGLADIRATREQAIELPLGGKAVTEIERSGGRLGKDARNEVVGQGVPADKIKVILRAHIRYAGTDTALVVDAGALASPSPGRGGSTQRAGAMRRGGVKRSKKNSPPPAALRAATSPLQGAVKLIPLAKMQRAFERAHKARFGFIDRSKQMMVEAVSVEAVGGGARFRERAGKTTRATVAEADLAHAIFLCRRLASRRRLYPRAAQAGAQGQGRGHHHRAASDHGGRAGLAGGADGEEPPGALAHQAAQAQPRHRHPCRPGDAGSVQQSVHVDRRADGRGAAEHRLFGEHQGAARLLLRGVFGRRHAGRQRAAHAGASRLHGPRGGDHHPREQGQDRARRRLRHQRALQRRHASAGHHRVHAGV